MNFRGNYLNCRFSTISTGLQKNDHAASDHWLLFLLDAGSVMRQSIILYHMYTAMDTYSELIEIL